jgi:cytochrome c peroxidase
MPPSRRKKTEAFKLILSAFLITFLACNDAAENPSIFDHLNPSPPELPHELFEYADIELPEHFTTYVPGPFPNSVTDIDNTPLDNPITDEGATLGRVLFYDTNLSRNGTISCASCHKQALGFSDDAQFSIGFNGDLTPRHSMNLVNARFYQRGRFFWDERATTLEEQVLEPFQDPIEMGLSLEELKEIIERLPYYDSLFIQAFGSDEIKEERISKAIAQFVRSIVSFESKYDQGRAQVERVLHPFPNFTESENRGKELFLKPVSLGGAGCIACHNTEAFTNANPGPFNNGLKLDSGQDKGAFETFPEDPQMIGAFKVPSLRDIALTAPYMHNGSLQSLEEVIDHYNNGIQAHPQLSAPLKDGEGKPIRLNLSPEDKSALIDFLHTLTDYKVLTDEKYSNPFMR